MDLLVKFNQAQIRNNFDFKVGDTVKVYQKVKEGDKDKIQIFEGIVIAKKHGTKNPNATFTVRKVVSGIGVEKIFPLHSPLITNVEAVKRSKARRAKLYFLREAKGKRSRLTRVDFKQQKEEQEKQEKEQKENEIVEKEELVGKEKEKEELKEELKKL